MSTQIRIRRAQDKIFQRTSELTQATIIPENYRERNEQATYDLRQATKTDMASKNQCYICQKCKNHGVLVWKKEHKRYCLYANCTCDQCELIEKRRKLDQILKCSKFKPNERRKERLPYPSTSMNSSDCSSMLSALADLNKQLIRQTYQLTVKMPFSQLNSSSYPLLISNSSSSSQTNISMESTGKSDMSQNALVYPVPLRPQSLLLPNAITNMPMLYTMRSPIDEFLNTFATMQFTFGIF
uniref:DM domain-containing protein n=1 Tax=Setaria digitata TaxID=48799 RepID=A0A915PSZ8_9BILA